MHNFIKNNYFLETDRIYLQVLDESHIDQITEYAVRNWHFHKFAMPDRPKDFYSLDGQLKLIEVEKAYIDNLSSIRYYLINKLDSGIIGDILINDIKKGNICSCTLGIKIDLNFKKQGYAKEALDEAINFIFLGLHLYRIEVNIIENNIESLNLFKKLGFKEEGIARAYFKTNGVWQDHLRFSLLADEWK